MPGKKAKAKQAESPRPAAPQRPGLLLAAWVLMIAIATGGLFYFSRALAGA